MVGGMGIVIIFIIIVGTFFTASYSIRLGVFILFKNLGVGPAYHFGETIIMLVPICGLYLFSVVAGGVLSWISVPFFCISLPLGWKLLIFLGVMLVMIIFLILLLGETQLITALRRSGLIWFIGRMWFIPYLSTFFIIPTYYLGGWLIKWVDQGWVEVLGGQGLIFSFSGVANKLDFSLWVPLKLYVFIFIVLGVILLVLLIYFNSLLRA